MFSATEVNPDVSIIDRANQSIQRIQSMPFDLQKVEGEQEFLLQVDTRMFYVGNIVYRILKDIQNGVNLSGITRTLYPLVGNVSEEETAEIINEKISTLFTPSLHRKKKPVKSLVKLIKPQRILALIRPLTPLFERKTFMLLFLASLVLNGAMLYLLNTGMIPATKIGALTTGHYAVYFCCVIFFIILHEIGHTVAALHHGVVPKNIGFGIYFLFPAFYTDLTEIWKLDRWKRIKINLAGIYFQLLLNIVIFAALLLSPQDSQLYFFLRRFIYFNIFISLYNINPFFRFDGYWVYSDIFNLPNLRGRSYGWLRAAWNWMSSKITGRTVASSDDLRNIPLLIYTLLYFCFMGFIWYYILKIVMVAHIKASFIIPKLAYFDVTRASDWQNVGPSMAIVTIFWSIIGYKVFRRIQNRSKQRRYANA